VKKFGGVVWACKVGEVEWKMIISMTPLNLKMDKQDIFMLFLMVMEVKE
jgi:hypothetical protein